MEQALDPHVLVFSGSIDERESKEKEEKQKKRNLQKNILLHPVVTPSVQSFPTKIVFTPAFLSISHGMGILCVCVFFGIDVFFFFLVGNRGSSSGMGRLLCSWSS
jgi:hypothetical protein